MVEEPRVQRSAVRGVMGDGGQTRNRCQIRRTTIGRVARRLAAELSCDGSCCWGAGGGSWRSVRKRGEARRGGFGSEACASSEWGPPGVFFCVCVF